mmetsp:Transcript_2139/g.4360  ORF Transcript_2139/g.4360 Transcript_2139/m.4360 type:complete len:570 (+) Transcript_2139:27-1736(+)
MLVLEILGYVFIGICTVYTAVMVHWVRNHDNPGTKLQKHIEKIQVEIKKQRSAKEEEMKKQRSICKGKQFYDNLEKWRNIPDDVMSRAGLSICEPFYYALWAGYVVSCLFFSILLIVLIKNGSSSTDSASTDAASSDNKSTYWLAFLPAFGTAWHSLIIPHAIRWKKQHVLEQAARQRGRTSAKQDGETIIFTLAFTPIQEVFVNTIGRILDFIDYLLGFTDSTPIGDILRVIWTPDPFWKFFKSRLLISNMRIKGARVELRISFSDAYFRMIEVKLYGFWSLKFSEFKRIFIEKQKSSEKKYNAWLDRNLRWFSNPPIGYDHKFKIFSRSKKGGFCAECKLSLMSPLKIIPGLSGIYYFHEYKLITNSMIIGGKKCEMSDKFTPGAMCGVACRGFMNAINPFNKFGCQMICTIPGGDMDEFIDENIEISHAASEEDLEEIEDEGTLGELATIESALEDDIEVGLDQDSESVANPVPKMATSSAPREPETLDGLSYDLPRGSSMVGEVAPDIEAAEIRAKSESRNLSTISAPPKWSRIYSKSNEKHFFFNEVTEEKVWRRPADYDGPDY